MERRACILWGNPRCFGDRFYLPKKSKPAAWENDGYFSACDCNWSLFRQTGMFFAGCRFDNLYNLPRAVSLFQSELILSKGTPLQPLHLYSALNSFLIFSILLLFRRYKKFDGQLFWLCILLFGIAGLLTAIFHGEYRGFYVYGIIPASYLWYGLMAATAVLVMIYRGKKKVKD